MAREAPPHRRIATRIHDMRCDQVRIDEPVRSSACIMRSRRASPGRTISTGVLRMDAVGHSGAGRETISPLSFRKGHGRWAGRPRMWDTGVRLSALTSLCQLIVAGSDGQTAGNAQSGWGGRRTNRVPSEHPRERLPRRKEQSRPGQLCVGAPMPWAGSVSLAPSPSGEDISPRSERLAAERGHG